MLLNYLFIDITQSPTTSQPKHLTTHSYVSHILIPTIVHPKPQYNPLNLETSSQPTQTSLLTARHYHQVPVYNVNSLTSILHCISGQTPKSSEVESLHTSRLHLSAS